MKATPILFALASATSLCERCNAPVIFTPESTPSKPIARSLDGSVHEQGWSGGCLTNREKAERAVDGAKSILRADYWNDVRGCAEEIKVEIQERVKEGERGGALREWLIERLHETIDGHARIIYTAQAQEVLLFSENDGVGVEEMGADSFDWSSGVPWSALAFHAMHADVIEHLEALDVDVNEPEKGFETDDEEDAA